MHDAEQKGKRREMTTPAAKTHRQRFDRLDATGQSAAVTAYFYATERLYESYDSPWSIQRENAAWAHALDLVENIL